MKYQVRITRKAEHDIDAALNWFRENLAEAAANRWFANLLRKIDTLESLPTRCGMAAESDEMGVELRELMFGRRPAIYRIVFLTDGAVVHILRIRHRRRDSLKPEEL